MKNLLSLAIFSMFTSIFFQNCGIIHNDFQPTTSEKPNLTTDETFRPYINEFEFYSKGNTSQIPIVFASLDSKTAGVCHYSKVGTSIFWGYIEIDKKYWPTLSEYQRINLIFHELGHCFYGREHIQPDTVRICPTSFMDPAVLSTSCIKDNYNAYIQEMFHVQAN